MRKILCLLVLVLAAYRSGPAAADDFDMEIKAFPERMMQVFKQLGDAKKVMLDKCIPASEQAKRTVCNYKLGDYMLGIGAGEPGSEQLSDLTLICIAKTDLAGARCVVAYAVAIATTSPSVEVEERGKIIKALFGGLNAGDSIQVTKDGRRYILQRIAGSLWFNIEANEPK